MAVTGSASYGDESPIAAFATNPGSGALTLIRCSGKGSVNIISSVFSYPDLENASGNTIIHGWITANNEKIDEVLLSVFRAPKSYTGEDSFDISCHGGASAGKAVMAALKTAGFREALPGEFTFRAFMNGKIDLTKSESVMELVCAKTDTSRRHAVLRLSGSLQKEVNEIKNLLVQVLASAEIYLDYSEDEVSAQDEDEIAGKLPNKDIALQALERLKKLSASWQLERIYQEGITLVIAGPPNAGKSSLFNSLLKEDRSIVTEVPGTTRDWIEAFVSIEGIPVRLIDTAGLREADDSVEKIGVERSRKILQEADIVLYLINEEEIKRYDIDGIGAMYFNTWHQEDNYQEIPYIYIWNKCDIVPLPQPFPIENIKPISVSAKTGEGLAELYSVIISMVSQQIAFFDDPSAASDASLGTARQKKLVDASCSALEEALALTESDSPLDLIAPLLREAVNLLGEITGEVSTADILEEMFSKFCVGK